VGERLTLPLPVSFDPVKGVNLIFQLPWRKLSRGCIFDKNAHTTQCFEKIWLLTYLRWVRLSEQIFRIDKWSVCRG
jgi:hypothetical protein